MCLVLELHLFWDERVHHEDVPIEVLPFREILTKRKVLRRRESSPTKEALKITRLKLWTYYAIDTDAYRYLAISWQRRTRTGQPFCKLKHAKKKLPSSPHAQTRWRWKLARSTPRAFPPRTSAALKKRRLSLAISQRGNRCRIEPVIKRIRGARNK